MTRLNAPVLPYSLQSHLSIFLIIPFLSFPVCFLGQNKKESSGRNKSLPKEINLNPGTTKIIDSIFTFKNGIQQLETIQVFDLNNRLIISSSRRYFVNDTINQTSHDIYDSNGNSIETNTVLHFKNSNRTDKKTLDKFGNITQLKTIGEGRTSLLEYRNNYKNNRLVSVTVMSKKSGNIIKKTVNNYDARGNLIEEWSNSASLDARNLYQFNAANQVILHKHVRNGILKDSVVYHYDKGLLSQKEWYENPSPGPMINNYHYNEIKQLISETEGDYDSKTYYKDYDTWGNWHVKEQLLFGKMNRLTKRIFIN